MTAPPETSTPVGRLRTAVLCAHDPGGLSDAAQDWLFSVLRDDLPKLLELYRTCCAGDERDVFDTLTRLDGRECVCPADDTLALCPEHGDGAEVKRAVLDRHTEYCTTAECACPFAIRQARVALARLDGREQT